MGEENCWWVCSVKPDLLDRIKGYVYVGLGRCRVANYYNYNQCFKCMDYGHRAKACTNMLTCVYCATTGHDINDCDNKQNPPKCSNCKGEHKTTNAACPTRARIVSGIIKKTSYSRPVERVE